MHQSVPEVFPAPSESELELEELEIRSSYRQQIGPYNINIVRVSTDSE
jgi:hypothetical protein